MYYFVVGFFLQFKQLQRVVTMALKSLYRVCEIKKLDLIFSSFSVRSQSHSYKNSIVFRLARHLCSSTSLVYIQNYSLTSILGIVITSVVSNIRHSDYLNYQQLVNKLAALPKKNNIARVIFVTLANKYGTTYLPQFLPCNGGSLCFNICTPSPI